MRQRAIARGRRQAREHRGKRIAGKDATDDFRGKSLRTLHRMGVIGAAEPAVVRSRLAGGGAARVDHSRVEGRSRRERMSGEKRGGSHRLPPARCSSRTSNAPRPQATSSPLASACTIVPAAPKRQRRARRSRS